MPPNKKMENEYAKLAKTHNWWAHKWSDARRCPHCNELIFPNNTEEETIVDYLTFIDNHPIWVEVKGKPGHTRIPFKEISSRQRSFLNSFTERQVLCLLFIGLGPGKAPIERKAWLMTWQGWLSVEYKARKAGMKSLPWEPTNRKADVYSMEVFKTYELRWLEGWELPAAHPFAQFMPTALTQAPLF